MDGRRGDEEFGEERPVEPEEARTSGNDPDAVRIHRRGGAGEERGEERSSAGRTSEAEGEETAGRGSGTPGMGRSDKTLITVLAVLGVLVVLIVVALTLLSVAEWVQFVLALALFVALLAGAYAFVIAPSGGDRRERGSS